MPDRNDDEKQRWLRFFYNPPLSLDRDMDKPADGDVAEWSRRSPAKGVDGKPSRGFESHRLRHYR